MLSKYLPYGPDFPEQLDSYCQAIKQVIKSGEHHDQRRHLLLDFLRKAFGIHSTEVSLERKVKANEVRGRIDALWRSLIIEVKSDIESERPQAKKELKKYFESQKYPSDYIGLLTDGVDCELYAYDKSNIKFVKGFEIKPEPPSEVFYNIDQLLYTAKSFPPTPEDIVIRFGAESMVFAKSSERLHSIYKKVERDSLVQTKFREWNALLAKVYGSRLGNEDLFIRHTYLTIISRLIVTVALFPEALRTKTDYRGLVDGKFFINRNLLNLAEPDFFSWSLGTEIEGVFIQLLEYIARHLEIYDFDKLTGDILKELYQGLIDPEDRHDLGEFYTPDWLAHLTLDTIDYRKGRLLDPSCGSGSFLIAAVERIRSLNRKGKSLLEYALKNLIGIDVHPVAVLMSKANIILALRREIKEHPRDIYLRIYMADTLMMEADQSSNLLHVPVSEREEFTVPLEESEEHDIDTIINELSNLARNAQASSDADNSARRAAKRLFTGYSNQGKAFWEGNFRLMIKLEREHRNSIWAYILKNAYRPVYLRREKVDVIVGNPPWLRYSNIRDRAYRSHVRQLNSDYQLFDRKDAKLFTSIELADLFFVHCTSEFLRDDGEIAFVMPKSCLIPSKQHSKFQEFGFTEFHDFSNVKPLFNVRACLMVRKPERSENDIPLVNWSGKLDSRNESWKQASQKLESFEGLHTFIFVDEPLSPYYTQFYQGATLVPRCLVFVEPAKGHDLNPQAPFVCTAEDAYKEAKRNWRLKIEGRIDRDYLFATALSKDLLPFGFRALKLVALPVKTLSDGKMTMIESEGTLALGHNYSFEWFNKLIGIYENKRQNTMSFQDRLNYQHLLSDQSHNNNYIVLYNAAGTNISAALYTKDDFNDIHGIKQQAFIVDAKCYRFYPKTLAEGDYLVGILNSNFTNDIIKPYQTEGLLGKRDVHRRPFEVCPIPVFDRRKKLHRQIADTSRVAHEELNPWLSKLPKPVTQAREEARRIVRSHLAKLDKLVHELYGSGFTSISKKKKQKDDNLSLFSDE